MYTKRVKIDDLVLNKKYLLMRQSRDYKPSLQEYWSSTQSVIQFDKDSVFKREIDKEYWLEQPLIEFENFAKLDQLEVGKILLFGSSTHISDYRIDKVHEKGYIDVTHIDRQEPYTQYNVNTILGSHLISKGIPEDRIHQKVNTTFKCPDCKDTKIYVGLWETGPCQSCSAK